MLLKTISLTLLIAGSAIAAPLTTQQGLHDLENKTTGDKVLSAEMCFMIGSKKTCTAGEDASFREYTAASFKPFGSFDIPYETYIDYPVCTLNGDAIDFRLVTRATHVAINDQEYPYHMMPLMLIPNRGASISGMLGLQPTPSVNGESLIVCAFALRALGDNGADGEQIGRVEMKVTTMSAAQ